MAANHCMVLSPCWSLDSGSRSGYPLPDNGLGTSFPKKQYPKRTQISEYFCNQIMNEFHIVRPISRYGAPSLVHMHMIYIAYCATVAFA